MFLWYAQILICFVEFFKKYKVSRKSGHSLTVQKTSLQYKCTENKFIVQVYRKPVYSTSVQKTSLQYKCTENQFTVKAYREPVYNTSVQKSSVEYYIW